MEDGPRLLKLKLSFEKMLEQILLESRISEGGSAKEELSISFQGLLLKYGIPLKLNELDVMIQNASAEPKRARKEESAEEVFAAHFHDPLKRLSRAAEEHTEKTQEEIKKLEEQEQSLDAELEASAQKIRAWMDEASATVMEIRKQTQ